MPSKKENKKNNDVKEDKKTETIETPLENSEETLVCSGDIEEMIRNRVYASMALGLAPIPLVDLLGLSVIQIDLVRVLAKKYNIPFKKNIAKTLVSALIGGVLPVGTAPLFASLVKLVPFVGYTTGAVSISLLGGASTYAVGRVFNKHFISGGTLLDMDTAKIKKGFKEQYEKGKGYVSSLKKTKEENTDSNEKTKTAAEPEPS